jgi:hypothetical protein
MVRLRGILLLPEQAWDTQVYEAILRNNTSLSLDLPTCTFDAAAVGDERDMSISNRFILSTAYFECTQTFACWDSTI